MIIMNSKKSIIINAAIIGTIIVGFFVVNFFTATPSLKVLSFENVGLQVPLKSLNTELSPDTSLKEYRGKNILIHFWASWCEACTADQKVMEQIAKEYADHSAIKVIGIASSDTEKNIEKSGLLKNVTFPQFLDETGNLALAMGVKTLPQTLLIDSQGRVLLQLTRPFDPQQRELVEKQINRFSQSTLPPFAFESSLGKEVNQSTLDQKVWVADFIFTSCGGTCPMLSAKMRLLQEAFKNDPRFKLVSISVDPETDTKEVLRAYQKKFNADADTWYFLRGSMDEVKSLLVNGFKLGTLEEPKYHTGKLILIDQSHKIRGYYEADSSESFEKLKNEISNLLK